MADSFRSKELQTRWPITRGLTAGTTRQYTHSPWLEPYGIHGVKTTIADRYRPGM